jgi:hypothetical protein
MLLGCWASNCFILPVLKDFGCVERSRRRNCRSSCFCRWRGRGTSVSEPNIADVASMGLRFMHWCYSPANNSSMNARKSVPACVQVVIKA